jgi:hypothetical protein
LCTNLALFTSLCESLTPSVTKVLPLCPWTEWWAIARELPTQQNKNNTAQQHILMCKGLYSRSSDREVQASARLRQVPVCQTASRTRRSNAINSKSQNVPEPILTTFHPRNLLPKDQSVNILSVSKCQVSKRFLLKQYTCSVGLCRLSYRGVDKPLARSGRKQAIATECFEFHISYL